ncbi:bifunctional isocitrate dehydrogenase kinase/phosphatase [Sandaracinus amylolyticus]|uniref:Isocitrate dehydrogenase phosphatase n=1 Tax=Sandaracinus amylolyticus TaxID=927083 RepID=A0A0F6YN25_9BACT|nr:bifunctional isocitrate dehydrogenase kinase/phosphatase [Sandaracinus amylolyticus]AKF10791.1 Isocitrate dehydrogenase phosphatase [Sandaracinus amylolyticus]
MKLAEQIAAEILRGFDKHYRIFRDISSAAKDRFERADWAASREAGRTRIHFYDQRVREAVDLVSDRFPLATVEELIWPHVKQAYFQLLYEHRQPECAETFFNSVACRVLDRRYYRNEYIFWRPAISTEYLTGGEPDYRSFYDRGEGLRGALRDVVLSYELRGQWQDLERDLDRLERAVAEHFGGPWTSDVDFQIQVLSSLFYRNKAAYLCGRARNGYREYPFVVPILKDEQGAMFLDALLLSPQDIGRVFSLARAYCMVDMEVPAAFVQFVSSMLPRKPRSEIYTLVGLQKQGKTLFYRDMMLHLKHSSDCFTVAPGTKGMVMAVFTLPSFPYVFKVIRDWFPPPKDVDRAKVEDRYLLVKHHDRVGRMADSLEYSHVAFPLERFEPELLAELKSVASSMIRIEGDQLIVKHLYIEKRLVPLDLFLQKSDEQRTRAAIREYGNAIKELASANIFAGDLLLKNFGITRFGRVVFYDYDEIGYLTDFKFRRIPKARDYDDEMSADPWFSVGPHDVFPEQFPTFLFADPKQREIFMELHGDLMDPAFWIAAQDRCRRGEQADIFPYPENLRFSRRFE